jgi:hypothetical protein
VLVHVRTQNLDEKERSKLSAEWDRPLPYERRRIRDDPWGAGSAADGQAFLAALGATGGRLT